MTKLSEETYYDAVRKAGVTRRDFLKFAAATTAFIGLQSSAIAQVVKALETKKRIPIIWEHFQECTGCSESFIRSDHPTVEKMLLDQISLDYSDTLMAASGHAAEAAKQKSMKENYGNYILVVEGAIPTKDDGVYCVIAGRTAEEILRESAAGALAIITYGSCSSYGGIQAASPNPTGSVPVHEIIKNKPIIKVPGCPPISEVMSGVIVHYLTFGSLPELDSQGRPKVFYSKRIHDSCYRRPYFDAGLYAPAFDSQEAKEGHCLFKLGCRGPVTYNSCSTMEWNNGTSFPIKSGNPCIGCSEAGFWDNGPFVERLTNIPEFGVESTADTIGKIVLGAAVGAAGVHAVATNFGKKKELKQSYCEGVQNVENIDE